MGPQYALPPHFVMLQLPWSGAEARGQSLQIKAVYFIFFMGGICRYIFLLPSVPSLREYFLCCIFILAFLSSFTFCILVAEKTKEHLLDWSRKLVLPQLHGLAVCMRPCSLLWWFFLLSFCSLFQSSSVSLYVFQPFPHLSVLLQVSCFPQTPLHLEDPVPTAAPNTLLFSASAQLGLSNASIFLLPLLLAQHKFIFLILYELFWKVELERICVLISILCERVLVYQE